MPGRNRPLRPVLLYRRHFAMSFDLILPFLRPIEPLLLDESVSEIMGNPDASWWYERDGIVSPGSEHSIRREQTAHWARSDRESSRQKAG